MINHLGDLDDIVCDVQFNGWKFHAGMMGEGYYVQVRFMATDNDGRNIWETTEQSGRKWYVSPHSTRAEVVQTCLKAVLTALEHEAREQFLYRGVPVFQPHIDLDALVDHALTSVMRAC